MSGIGRALREGTGRSMAAAVLAELESGTGRAELRRMLAKASGGTPPPALRERRTGSRGPAKTAGRGKNSRDLSVIEKAASTAGEMIHSDMEGYPRRIREMEDILRIPFSREAAETAALVLMNAVARTGGGRVRTRSEMMERWEAIVSGQGSERFIPVLPMASQLLRCIRGRESERGIHIIAQAARSLRNPAAAGELMQRLVPERKKLAAYHTRDSAAALMAQLAVPVHRDWSGSQALHYRIADYSCGTGTLLCAVVRRVRDLARAAGAEPARLHRRMMEQCITAADILPASVAIAATELDALEENPCEYAESTGGITLRHGPIPGTRTTRGRPARKSRGGPGPRAMGLGALDLLHSNSLKRQDARPIAREGSGREGPALNARSQSLVIMNPPFTKETEQPLAPVGNEAPPTERERQMAKERMREIRSITLGGPSNGQAYHFAMLAHRMVATGGTIALLLPETALTGSGNAGRGWPEFRRTLVRNYQDIRVVGITAFEQSDSALSHDTQISEVILLARKKRKGDYHRRTADFVTLSRRPRDGAEAARTGDIIRDMLWDLGDGDPGDTRQACPDGMEIRAIKARLPEDGSPWRETRVNGQHLNRGIEEFMRGRIRSVPLGSIARVGPENTILGGWGRRIGERNELGRAGDGGEVREVPAMIAHECEAQRAIEAEPNGSAAIGEDSPLRLSRLHINNNFRYNSQSTAACMTREPSVGSRFWPTIGLEEEAAQKALAVWMNTTPGLVAHWHSAVRTQHGMGYLSSRNMKDMMVLDPGALGAGQLEALGELFEEVKTLPLLPANEAWRDGTRIELDRRVMEILRAGESAIEDAARIRNQWCLEPTVVGRKGRVRHRQPDMERLRELAGAA